jgi:hypothetical protein
MKEPTTIESVKKKQIIKSENKLLEALKVGNIEVLEELLHDNLIFNIPTGQTITKTIDIENYRSGILKVCDIVVNDQIIKITGDIATVAVTLNLKLQYASQLVDGKFRYLRVWKLDDNSWKVIAGSGFQIH